MIKTLVGKHGYLFLQNDSSRVLDVHCKNLNIVNKKYLKKKYDVSKTLLVIIPDKCIAKAEFLPDKYTAQYRPAFDVYKNLYPSNIVDCIDKLRSIDSYYKTDTHINVLGGYEIYKCTVPILQKKLKVDIKHVNIKIQHIDTALDILNKGLGDLTWETNAKNLSVDKSDRFYYSSEYNYIYMQKYKDINIDLNFFNYKFDMISVNSDTIIDWNFISNTIISCEPQDSKKTVIILYDSTLLGVLGLWIRTFAESQISAYFIKNTFDRKIIDLIKYDYLVEFRCERFLR